MELVVGRLSVYISSCALCNDGRCCFPTDMGSRVTAKRSCVFERGGLEAPPSGGRGRVFSSELQLLAYIQDVLTFVMCR
jgi:hypothetical protein